LQGKEYERNRFRTYEPEELIGLALSRPARFEPGTSYSYSNTGYILLGELVERLTRTPYAFQVWQRILRPLRLHDTLLPGSWTGVPGPHAHAYYAYRHQDRLRVLDVTRANLTWGGAAGEIISTTRDLDRFVTALLGGALLPPDLLAEMREQVPIPEGGGYGLGLAVFDAGPACGGVFYGHDGGLPGYLSYMLSTSDRGKRIELSVTLGALDVGDPQAVQRFFIALNGVVAAALCQDPRSADLKTLDHDLVGGLAVTGR
jgi:D-alanyl-D-alanine carboxypeptidase